MCKRYQDPVHQSKESKGMNAPITIECKMNPPNETDKAISKMIETIRRHQGYTPEYIAEKTKLDLKQYHYREQGWMAFSGSELHKIAIALNVPVQIFFSAVEGQVTDIEKLIFYTQCEDQLSTVLYALSKHKNPNEFLDEFRNELEDLMETRKLN